MKQRVIRGIWVVISVIMIAGLLLVSILPALQ